MSSAGIAGRIQRAVAHGWATGCVLLIILVGAVFRLTAYGDLRLSVATLDTQSYVDSSRASLLSWGGFAGRRPFTMNLVYRLARAPDCTVTALSMPAIGKEAKRAAQDCFSTLVVFQSIFSVVAWGFAIFALTMLLTSNLTRALAAIVLTAMAFAPQVADWDSVLTSESLSFSLFALLLGLLTLHVRDGRQTPGDTASSPRSMVLGAFTALTASLWILVRDTHVYAIVILIVMAIPLMRPPTSARWRGWVALALIAAVGVLSIISASQSQRWQNGLGLAMDEFVLPYPARVATLERLGMPSPESPEYRAWFEKRGPLTYLVFLGLHPGFVVTTLTDSVEALFAENNQPYFKTSNLPLRETALRAGDLLHSRSGSVLVVDILAILTVAVVALADRRSAARGPAVLLVWLAASGFSTLVISFFADPSAVQRHVVFSVFLLRFISWLGILFLVDLALGRRAHDSTSPTNGNPWNRLSH